MGRPRAPCPQSFICRDNVNGTGVPVNVPVLYYLFQALTEHCVKFLQIQNVNANLNGDLRIIVRIASTAVDFFYELCGNNSVVTGVYYETDEDKNWFSVVPMNLNRADALKVAQNQKCIY